jgi:predicted DsbA family dithiol-disulfide isomerase
MATVTITEFTDPGCPVAWSAEPARRRLHWLYGDRLAGRLRMVGLAEHGDDAVRAGFTPERQAEVLKQLAASYGMPIDTSVRPRMAATLPACRAVVATRCNQPESERAILRSLRVLTWSGRLLDETETLRDAAALAGVDGDELETWMSDVDTDEALAEDLRLTRDPTPAAVALAHKLASTPDGGHRYTCPSYELERAGERLSVPGLQPAASYETAVANLAPELERRAEPSDVAEVLRWAGEPLASAEVASVCGIDARDAREQLGRVATERHIGADGLWSLA